MIDSSKEIKVISGLVICDIPAVMAVNSIKYIITNTTYRGFDSIGLWQAFLFCLVG